MATLKNHRRSRRASAASAVFARVFLVLAVMMATKHESSMAALAWVSSPLTTQSALPRTTRVYSTTKEKPSVPFFAAQQQQEVKQEQSKTKTTAATTTGKNKIDESLEETTQKYGLEVGLFKSLQQRKGGADGKSGNNLDSAKSLLKKYGIAYLATSIPLAALSFALFYILVDNGVDVAALLNKIGIEQVSETTSTAGTVAIAYAAHKAASPIRFPPTVILTPIVAKWIGKEPNNNDEEGESSDGTAKA
jgi:Protein of unknown function (DUF1279)